MHRVALAGGEKFNGFELWRRLYITHAGGSEQVQLANIWNTHSFPSCKDPTTRSTCTGRWQQMVTASGSALPQEQLKNMFRNIRPGGVKDDVAKRRIFKRCSKPLAMSLQAMRAGMILVWQCQRPASLLRHSLLVPKHLCTTPSTKLSQLPNQRLLWIKLRPLKHRPLQLLHQRFQTRFQISPQPLSRIAGLPRSRLWLDPMPHLIPRLLAMWQAWPHPPWMPGCPGPPCVQWPKASRGL